MPRPEPIRVEEWLRALAKEMPTTVDGFCRRDVERVFGIKTARASDLIRTWHARGLIIFAGHALFHSVDGTLRKRPVYRLTDPPAGRGRQAKQQRRKR